MTNQNIQKAPIRKTVMDLIQSPRQMEEFAKVLPSTLSKERFVRIAITSITKNPRLMMCTPESLIRCMLESAQAGLEIDGRRAHLIPYGQEATLVFDYKGLVELTKRSGEVKDIHAEVVYPEDEFSFAYGSDRHLRHTPKIDGPRNKPYCAYSFAVLAKGEFSFDVMSWAEIMTIRDNSRGWKAFKAGKAQSSIWADHEAEMAKKSVIRRHSKNLTLSPEAIDLLEREDDDVKPAPKTTTTVVAAMPDDDIPWVDPLEGTKAAEPPPEGGAPIVAEVVTDIGLAGQILEAAKEQGLVEKDLKVWAKSQQHSECRWSPTQTLADLPELSLRWWFDNLHTIIPMARALRDKLGK